MQGTSANTSTNPTNIRSNTIYLAILKFSFSGHTIYTIRQKLGPSGMQGTTINTSSNATSNSSNTIYLSGWGSDPVAYKGLYLTLPQIL